MTTAAYIRTASSSLSSREIQQYRNIIKTSIVLIIMWRLGRPTGSSEIAKILGINRETASNYLESLNMTGFVTRTELRDGYRLTDDGRQLMLQVPAGYLLDETLETPQGQNPQVITVEPTSEIPTFEEKSNQERQNRMSEFPAFKPPTSEFPSLNGGNSDIQTGSIRLIEEDSLNINDKDLLQSEPEKSDLPSDLPPVEKLLEAMSVLRGRKGNPDFPWESPGPADIPRGTSPRLCLAWIVKSYCDREGLHNPVGVICARLRAKTARSLPKNWQERLPAEFLAEIGIEPEVSESVDRVTQAVEEFLRRR